MIIELLETMYPVPIAKSPPPVFKKSAPTYLYGAIVVSPTIGAINGALSVNHDKNENNVAQLLQSDLHCTTCVIYTMINVVNVIGKMSSY